MKRIRLLLGVSILLFVLLAASVSCAQVLVLAFDSDASKVTELIQADTQVIVLCGGTTKERQPLSAAIKKAGAPDALYGSFKRLKQYTSAKVNSDWVKAGKANTSLVAMLRRYAGDEVLWYTDPAKKELREGMLTLLTNDARDAADPNVRGSENVDQYGLVISTLKAADTGEVTQVPDSGWLKKAQKAFGDVITPVIPNQPQLTEAGFMEEGSFHYSSEQDGVWYYVDSSLSVTITRHSRTGDDRLVWYEADIIRSADSDSHLHCVRGGDGSKKAVTGSSIAQGWVFAINGDYHHARKTAKGLIIRDGKVEDASHPGKLMAKTLPNLDTLLLKKDGTFSTKAATLLTAKEALAQNACDVLAFGPLFVTQGRWRQLNFLYHGGREPRMAIGQVEPNHYLVIFAEGRLKSSLGISLDELQQLFLVRGCDEAINLDGGGTACMFFMGQSVGGVGENWGTTYRKPRGQWEMLTIGKMSN